MTYREKLKDCMDPFELDQTEIGLGRTEMLAMPFPEFLRSIAVLLVMDAQRRATLPFPDLTTGWKTYKGNPKKNPSADDVIKVLNGADVMRYHSQWGDFYMFISWLLDQEVDEEDLWFAPSRVIDTWNEYVRSEADND